MTSILLTPLIVTANTFPVDNFLYWSGTNWHVDTTPNNAWLDDQNNIHMKLQEVNGKWCGSVLESSYTIKYGKLTWTASSPSLNLEKYSTVGLYTYKDDNNELDIELNQWPGYDEHVYFTKQPGNMDYHPENFICGVYSQNSHLNDTNIRYSIDWTPTYVYYSAIAPDGTKILDWNYTNPSGIPSVNSSICMGILPTGSYSPATGTTPEVVLHDFTYIPYESCQAVQLPPVANFTSNLTFGTVPLTVKYNDMSINNPTSWLWDFGDGIYSTQQSPIHTYSSAGTYTVKLTVSGNGKTDSKSSTITVSVPSVLPVVGFTANVTKGSVPLTVHFNDIPEYATGWSWNFGDGTYSTQRNPVHTYNKTGKYTVSLTVANADGSNTVTKSNYIVVTDLKPPIASFVMSKPSGKAPLIIYFTDRSTGTISSKKWSFGDGTTSTAKSPSHKFTKAGKFKVVLTVSNKAGNSSKYQYVTITPAFGR